VSAHGERPSVDRLETELARERHDGGLCIAVVAGDRHHQLAAGVARVRHVVGAGGVERLDHPRARSEPRHGLAGGIVVADRERHLGRQRIGGVDDHLARERTEALHRLRQRRPGHRQHDHLACRRGILHRGNAEALLLELRDLGRGRIAHRHGHLVLTLAPAIAQSAPDIACAHDHDVHVTSLACFGPGSSPRSFRDNVGTARGNRWALSCAP
jgi:hypothetical protein